MTGFPKSARVLRRADFRQTMDHGAKIVCPGVVLFATPRSTATSASPAAISRRRGDGAATRVRFGVVVSKKVGNSVVRNRVKRRLREAWRALRPEIERAETFRGLDVVALARPQMADAASADVAQGLTRCLDRLAQRLTAAKGR